LIVTAVVTMAAVHEHMHERASKKRKPDEQPEHVRPVLGEQQREGNDQKPDQHYSGLGFRGHALSCWFLLPNMILQRHWTTPSSLDGKAKPPAVLSR
jgi:hypothetical protein